jgi:hypothetical protein
MGAEDEYYETEESKEAHQGEAGFEQGAVQAEIATLPSDASRDGSEVIRETDQPRVCDLNYSGTRRQHSRRRRTMKEC